MKAGEERKERRSDKINDCMLKLSKWSSVNKTAAGCEYRDV